MYNKIRKTISKYHMLDYVGIILAKASVYVVELLVNYKS